MKDTITRSTIHTLQDFYDLMEQTAAIRRKAVVSPAIRRGRGPWSPCGWPWNEHPRTGIRQAF